MLQDHRTNFKREVEKDVIALNRHPGEKAGTQCFHKDIIVILENASIFGDLDRHKKCCSCLMRFPSFARE